MGARLVISTASENYRHESSLSLRTALFIFITGARHRFSRSYYGFVFVASLPVAGVGPWQWCRQTNLGGGIWNCPPDFKSGSESMNQTHQVFFLTRFNWSKRWSHVTGSDVPSLSSTFSVWLGFSRVLNITLQFLYKPLATLAALWLTCSILAHC